MIAGEEPTDTPPPRSAAKPAVAKTKPKENLPLTANEKTRSLMDPPLWKKLVTDVAAMSPAASAYVRRHPSLSSAAMQKWHVGILPADGGGDIGVQVVECLSALPKQGTMTNLLPPTHEQPDLRERAVP